MRCDYLCIRKNVLIVVKTLVLLRQRETERSENIMGMNFDLRPRYAGIGSRKTPNEILVLMKEVACKLEADGYVLRSGGADGADTAFELGVGNSRSKSIYYASDYEPSVDEYIERLHPAPNRLSSYARKLIGRNVKIILGDTLHRPVDFVICWTPAAEITGGTGFTIKVAKDYSDKIDIFNLADESVRKRLERYVGR